MPRGSDLVALVPEDISSLNQIIESRPRLAFADPESLEVDVTSLKTALLLEKAARRALTGKVRDVIAEDGVQMFLQPIVTTQCRCLAGVEALARFPHAPRVPPIQWFETAATVGLSVALEHRAMAEALALLPEIPKKAFLSVNVSPRALVAASLDDILADVDMRRLVFEVTEHSRVDDYGPLLSRVKELREAGARFAVDDTGAGWSSMKHVMRLEPEILKLDRSLVDGVDESAPKRSFAAAMVQFATEVGSVVVAEGIETEKEMCTMTEIGAHLAQGFALGRPTGDRRALPEAC